MPPVACFGLARGAVGARATWEAKVIHYRGICSEYPPARELESSDAEAASTPRGTRRLRGPRRW